MGDSRFTGQEEDEFDRTVSAFSAPRHGNVTKEAPEREEDAPEQREVSEPEESADREFPEPEEEEEDEFDRTVSAFSARQGKARAAGQEVGKKAWTSERTPQNKTVSGKKPAKGIGAKKPMSLGLVITLSVLAGILLAGISFFLFLWGFRFI